MSYRSRCIGRRTTLQKKFKHTRWRSLARGSTSPLAILKFFYPEGAPAPKWIRDCGKRNWVSFETMVQMHRDWLEEDPTRYDAGRIHRLAYENSPFLALLLPKAEAWSDE